ncbi:MAG TPA: nuclear transport factor 2 family protein [Anaerolineales bacterium]|nr:nuclear transport factor 2 family protein [Anaerolineales bacterium]
MNDPDKLLHTIAITEVINRYCAAVDQKQFDMATMSQIFAESARVIRPNGTITTGPKEIGESHRQSFSHFQATQHLTSGFLITWIDRSTARFRANLVAMHIWAEGEGDPSAASGDNYFLAGGVITGQVALATDGWRITEFINEPTWRQGTGFQQMLKMFKTK